MTPDSARGAEPRWRTGANPYGALALGLLAMVLGTFLVAFSRRRRV